MPNIEFDDDTIKKVRNRTGMYRNLKIHDSRPNPSITEVIVLKVKAGFLDYARRHGCKPDMEATEWKRFEKFLRKYL